MSLERLLRRRCLSPKTRSDLGELRSEEVAWRLPRLPWPRMVAEMGFKWDAGAPSLVIESLGQHADAIMKQGNNAAKEL